MPESEFLTAEELAEITGYNGVTYEAYVAAGWSDAQLVQNGLMLA